MSIKIKSIAQNSSAFKAGLRKGDRIISINGKSIHDSLDFTYWSACDTLAVRVIRENKEHRFTFLRTPGDQMGVIVSDSMIRRCANRCVFCFIDQLPKGMRKSLYIKDEDYRHSFFNGNYITLTSLSKKDLDKIITYHLSPLYVSVHATDPVVRKKMLRNSRADRIVEQLRTLEHHGIQFHTQIVVCPGINDNTVLRKTIKRLLAFKRGLLSVAVVPVGLTKYHMSHIQPISGQDALKICTMTQKISEDDKKRFGFRRLFLADELFLKAQLPIPTMNYYENFPQIENGIGLIREVLEDWKETKSTLIQGKKGRYTRSSRMNCLLVTSVSAQQYIQSIAQEIMNFFNTVSITVVAVRNAFFGESVTVAGLLTARDIITVAKKQTESFDMVVVPSVILNYKNVTLDGFSIERMAKNIGCPVMAVDSISQLISCFRKKRKSNKSPNPFSINS